MSQNWDLVPLGEILIKSNNWIQIEATKKYKQITVKIWGKGVVERNEVMGTEIAASQRLQVSSGQFIVSRIDARHGAFGLIPDCLDAAVVTNDFPVFNLNINKVLPQFLNWMSKTNTFIELCKASSEGTTNRVRLKEDKFLSMKIPLPPLQEQQQIVAKIEELATKIEEARGLKEEAIKECDKIWKTFINKLFLKPNKYNYYPLGDLVTIQGGNTPSKSNPLFWNGLIPWICPKDMKTQEIYDSIEHITEDALKHSSAKLINPGCVLIVVRGMILAHTVPSGILRVPAAINQDMKALIPNEKIIPEYLCSILWGLNNLLLELIEKSSHDTRKLQTTNLLNFEIPVPPLSEQQEIVTYLDNLQTKIDEMKRLRQESLKELNALLPAILDKAFKGEL